MKEYILSVAQGGYAAGKALVIHGKMNNEGISSFEIKRGITETDERNDGIISSDAGNHKIESRTKEDEVRRFDEAVSALEQELATAAGKYGSDNAAIFEAEIALLKDDGFAGEIRRQISDGEKCSEDAIRETGCMLADMLRASDSEYISQRAGDVIGLAERLLNLLEIRSKASMDDRLSIGDNFRDRDVSGEEMVTEEAVVKAQLKEPMIIVAEELGPAQIAFVDAELVQGIVTAKGAPTSHISIIAANLGIPYYYGSEEAVGASSDGMLLVLDDGRLIIEPEGELPVAEGAQRRNDHAGAAERISIAAPADGKLIPMEDIPDPVFSAGTLGDCAGVLPENGNIYAPCDGVVMGVAETKHAITFRFSDGRKLLLHAGIDTVNLGGRGFEVFVSEGDSVTCGDLVMKANLSVIKGAGLSPIVIISYLE